VNLWIRPNAAPSKGATWALHFRELYTEVVRVPMTASADSLNMVVAASMVLHETASQLARPRPGG
jgi:tRNA(Leu) C34 or U34 (ribose-2'-O)-methylase TrmL